MPGQGQGQIGAGRDVLAGVYSLEDIERNIGGADMHAGHSAYGVSSYVYVIYACVCALSRRYREEYRWC
jgi:hypothetical protein